MTTHACALHMACMILVLGTWHRKSVAWIRNAVLDAMTDYHVTRVMLSTEMIVRGVLDCWASACRDLIARATGVAYISYHI